jgi:RND superfamily putative drug exporter
MMTFSTASVARMCSRHPGRTLAAWGAAVSGAISLGLATAGLVALALPAFGLNTGTAGVSTLPNDLPAKQGYLALRRDFVAHTADPVHVLVTNHGSPAATALGQLRDQLAGDPRFGPGQIRVGTGGVADLVVPVRGDPTGGQAIAAVRDLREQIIPAAFR